VQGLATLKKTFENLGLPYVIFGPDTPITLVAEYAAKLAESFEKIGGKNKTKSAKS